MINLGSGSAPRQAHLSHWGKLAFIIGLVCTFIFCASLVMADTPAAVVAAPGLDAHTYSASISPTTDTAGNTLSQYDFRITSGSSSESSLGSVNITVPVDYRADLVIVSVTTNPSSNDWTATFVGSVIQLRADNNSDRLDHGEWVQVRFTATAPCTSGTYAWDSQVKEERDFTGVIFSLSGSSPQVVVSGSCDTTPPDTSITAQPSNPSNSTSASFSFTGSDNVTPAGSLTFECKLDAGSWASCTSPKSYTSLSQASHTFQVRATDQAGNTDATPASYTWVVDTTAPDTSITAQPSNPSNSTSASFSFTGSDSVTPAGSLTFECKLDAGSWASCTSPKSYSSLSQASHTFQVRATDQAGNTDATPASYTWVVDITAPDTSITAQPSNPSNSTSASFSFTGTDNVTPAGSLTFECKLDAGSWASCTSPKSYTSLSQASHTFQVRATDQAGNTDATPASYTWVVDTTAPDTSITAQPSNPSNSTSASFSFTGSDSVTPAGSLTFECKLDAGSWASCTSPKSYTGLSQASHTFQVRATDQAGNTDATPASYTWVVDTTPPDTSITAQPSNPINSTSASFSFTGSDNVTPAGSLTFECKLDAGSWASCTSPKSYSSLAEGSHTFQVRATDQAGNTDATPASYTWVVDTIAPDTSITAQPNTPSKFNSASFTFTGSDPGGSGVASFECDLDGGGFAACTTPKTYTDLSEGSHTFQVRATDNAGNTDATPASYTWVVDTIAPDTSITAQPNDPTNSTSASFSFTGSDPGGSGVASFQCDLDSGGFTACASPKSYTSLSEGSHTFQVRSIDNAGNTDATPASFTWFVDLTAPDTTITSNPNNPTNSAAATFTFTASDNHTSGPGLTLVAVGFAYECKLDNGSWESCSSPKSYLSLSDGSHTFQVRATDEAGNTDPTPASFTWVVDTTAPDTTITSNPSNPTSSTSASFSFTGNDGTGSGVASFECDLDGGGFTACASSKSYTSLSEGSHTFQVRAIDNVGNTDATPASFTWFVDLTAPDTTITSNPNNPTNSAAATFTFTASDNHTSGPGLAGSVSGFTYECKLDTGAWGSCTSPKSYSSLTDGSHTFQVRATDEAGNTDATPASYTWVVDTTAPDTTITSNPSNPTSSTSATFTFTGNDGTGSGVASFECDLDGGGFTACATPKTYTGLSEGSHTFQVRAIDNVGNTDATPASYTWLVDTTPPDTTIVTGPAAMSNQSSATFTFTGNDGAGSGVASFECDLDGGGFAACTTPKTYTGLAEGYHTFQVRSLDAVGHTDPTPASQTWLIDLTPPQTIWEEHPPVVVGGGSGPALDARGPSITFMFHGLDQPGSGPASGVSHLECQIDGGPFVVCTSPQTYSNLREGSHTFAARAIDNAGNVDGTPLTHSWSANALPRPTPTPTPYPTPVEGCLTPIMRVDIGSTQVYTDSKSQVWQADQQYITGTTTWGYFGGATYATHAAIAGTSDPTIYQTERWWSAALGVSGYRFALPNGDYKVWFHVAEIYPWISKGVRVFDIYLEGQNVINNLDVFAVAGRNRAYGVWRNIHVSDGVLTLDLVPEVGSAALNALEIYRIDTCTAAPPQ